VERAMKIEEVLLRATAGKIMWWQAAEMIGISEIVEQLRFTGEEIMDNDLARVSPLCFAHIIPNGTYNFERDIPGDNPACYTLP
jgi:hypothetical protein